MKTIEISKLDRLEDIYKLVESSFLNKRHDFKRSSIQFKLIFDDFSLGIINISSLNMLVCLLFALRKHYDFPFIGSFKSHHYDSYLADSRKSAFLKAVGFIEITESLRLIQWKFTKKIPDIEFNPNTGIFQIDVSEVSRFAKNIFPEFDPHNDSFILLNELKKKSLTADETHFKYEEIKTEIKNEIKYYIRDFVENIFTGSNHGRVLKINIISFISEIISNSFIHGRTKPFVALQRTSKNITISICDDGLGLKKSFEKLHALKIDEGEALIKALKHRSSNSYGLFDIVHSVLGYQNPTFISSDAHHGFFTISSGSKILKITRNNYEKLLSGDIYSSIHDTRLPIRGVRVNMVLLIK